MYYYVVPRPTLPTSKFSMSWSFWKVSKEGKGIQETPSCVSGIQRSGQPELVNVSWWVMVRVDAIDPVVTAILSCRYGPHEKSWKIGLGPFDLKSRPSPHCWVRRNSRESTNFHFGPVEGGFPGQRTTTKAPSLHTNCNWLRPQGLKLRPQGMKAFLPNFST